MSKTASYAAKLSGTLAAIGNTPMATVDLLIRNRKRRVFLKLESYNPTGSSKDRTARALIEDAEAHSRLTSSSVIVESTSGNLGVALAFVCRAMGYPFIAVVDPKATKENLQKMRSMGAMIEMVEEPDETMGYLSARLSRVQEICRASNYLWLDQYSNLANPLIHYATTGPEIYRQLEKRVDAIFIAVSTGGTLAGVARFFRAASPGTRIIAVDAVGSLIFGGRPARRRLTGIGSAKVSTFIDKTHYDLVEWVGDEDAFLFCRNLLDKTGIHVGGSSGAVLVACARYLETHPEVENAVCLCPDTGENYRSTIFDDQWLKENGVVLQNRSPVQEIWNTSGEGGHCSLSHTQPGLL
jgi:2,3-diaminopropionate biosynthesis protein SbnA